MFYVSLRFIYSNNFLLIILTEDLLRKENAMPQKAHAIPTKAQRPPPPRHIASPPPVSILSVFRLTNNACVSRLLYLNLAIMQLV
jgi:hypothetical protein